MCRDPELLQESLKEKNLSFYNPCKNSKYFKSDISSVSSSNTSSPYSSRMHGPKKKVTFDPVVKVFPVESYKEYNEKNHYKKAHKIPLDPKKFFKGDRQGECVDCSIF